MASTVNANVNTSSITTTTSAVAGDMINSNTRHRSTSGSSGGGGGSRMVSSSPWTQIVRGDSSDPIAATASSNTPSSAVEVTAAGSAVREVDEHKAAAVAFGSSSPSSGGGGGGVSVGEEEGCENGGGNAGKKPVWNKPSNGGVEIGAVMGAVSWPALSESAAARVSGTNVNSNISNKQQDSSSSSIKGDGSSSPLSVASVPQGGGSGSSSMPMQKQGLNAHNNTNAHTPNHTARQRSMKRNGGATSSSNGAAAAQPPGSQQPQTGEVNLNNPSPRDHGSQRNSQSRGANDHPQQQQRNSFRRNGGPHARDGSHHHNYGARRDQDRPNQEWNNHRNFSGRDGHMQPQRVAPRFIRPPPPPPLPTTSTPFMGGPAIRAFGSPVGFHEIAPPVYYVTGPPDPLRGVPFVAAPMPTMYFPTPDLNDLPSKIVKQIDYYFSNDNLIKDTFLRQNMDDRGWVPINLIASFKKVSGLTDNIRLISDAIKSSTVVEVQGDKVRKQQDWMRWVMPPAVQFPNVSGPPSLGRPIQDMLAGHVQSSLEETSNSHSSVRNQVDVHNEAFIGRSSSGDFNSQWSQASSSEGTSQVSLQGLDSSTSVRNLSK